MVLLLRLAPVVPFAALNYAMGATSVGLWPYTWASALGIVPGAAPMHSGIGLLAAKRLFRERRRSWGAHADCFWARCMLKPCAI